MRVCVVGGGGREHALAGALARPGHHVVVTPGNAGIPGSTPRPPTEIDADLFVIGPEVPLVDGLADRLRAQGKAVFGPGADGARLEGSKAWMKQLLASAGVPTARYGVFTEAGPAIELLRSLPPPWVVKTDGLAAGKGVLVTSSLAEAEADIEAKLSGAAFGEAGRRVVVEEGLSGPEVSLLCVCDGQRAVPLEPAQDFKRLLDGDAGPNTGGMGAYSPVPGAGKDLVDEVMERAVGPTLAALGAQGTDYRGVLYCGLMLTPDGPKVLEYNVRFGDPETQVVLPRYTGDLAELLAEAAHGDLRTVPVWDERAAVTVVLAAGGYPSAPRTGDPIAGLEAAAAVPGVSVFYAGVTRAGTGGATGGGPGGPADGGEGLVTAGGRVLNVTALGRDLTEARARAYEAAGLISWPGVQFRRDIAAAAATGEVG